MPRPASASTTDAAGRGSRKRELVEEAAIDELHAGDRGEPLGGLHRRRMVEPGQPGQPRLAEQRQVDREGQRAEPGIGADVAGRLLAADVLLARRQGQHPAAPPIGIDGLADEPPRHLPHEFFAGGEQPDIGAAEIERVAEGLAFGGDDVGAHLAGRTDGAERQRFR